jgi:hypothetical protein
MSMTDHTNIAWADRTASGDGARPRTEVLRLNSVCWRRLEIECGADLFSSLPQLETVA